MIRRLTFTAAAAAALIGVSATTAHAKSVDVSGTASCSAGARAKIKAGPRDPGQIKTNVQIDANAPGTWTITVVDGAETRSATLATAGVSNSIDRDFFTTNNAGADTVTFTARRANSTATCSGSVTV
jgi:hypothetical protein